MLHAQLRAYTSVPDLGDPLFSMWRLAWVAHKLPVDPFHLFDANIFHPAEHTLAYSDAMLLPAFLGAPALWVGVPLAVVYTTLLVLSFVAAGLSMFALVRAVTRHDGAALVAGLVFAFDPFRFSHYSHLELLFTCWMPLAVLFTMRAAAPGEDHDTSNAVRSVRAEGGRGSTRRRRDGVLAGVVVALQALSSLYYGAFLAVSLAMFVVAWFVFVQRPSRAALSALALGVVVAAAAALMLAAPYSAARRSVGERGEGEVRGYSATLRDYATVDARNAAYRARLPYPENGERELFPGTTALVLGAAGLLVGVGPIVVPAAIALVASVDASLGLNGVSYSLLYRVVPPMRAFRVPARFRAIVGMWLALLSGVAVAGLARRLSTVAWSHVVVALVAVLVLIDLHPTLDLQPVWDHAPDIYARIPRRDAVVADLPLPWGSDPFWHDPVFMYFSTFHWHPLINGSSGFYPSWYEPLGQVSRDFPSDAALDAYARLGTEYFVLHQGFYRDTFTRVVADAAAQARLQFVAATTWEEGECRLYRLLH